MTAARTAADGGGSVSAQVATKIAGTFGWLAATFVLIGVLWEMTVRALNLNSFGTKSAGDVLAYLFTAPAAAEHRAELATALGQTAFHAVAGFTAGTAVGIALALALVAIPALQRPVIPLLLLTQAVPILAVLPLFILLLGRGLVVTIVITTLAVFFPMFVMVTQGLRSPRSAHLDYFASLDASPAQVLLRLRIPSAVPSLFAATKVSVPSAMFGAIVSEWLATGDGLGYLMTGAAAGVGGYSKLWAAVALTTAFTMIWYALVTAAETVALGRFAPERLHAD